MYAALSMAPSGARYHEPFVSGSLFQTWVSVRYILDLIAVCKISTVFLHPVEL